MRAVAAFQWRGKDYDMEPAEVVAISSDKALEDLVRSWSPSPYLNSRTSMRTHILT